MCSLATLFSREAFLGDFSLFGVTTHIITFVFLFSFFAPVYLLQLEVSGDFTMNVYVSANLIRLLNRKFQTLTMQSFTISLGEHYKNLGIKGHFHHQKKGSFQQC